MKDSILFKNSRFTILNDNDDLVGEYYVLSENEFETPDGEGVVFDWSDNFGYGTNYTGLNPNDFINPLSLILQYIIEQYEYINEQ